MECNKCNNEQEFKEIKKILSEHGRRLTDLETDKKLNIFQYEQIMEMLKELKTDMSEMKEKPSKRWDLVITGLISAATAFIASIILK